MHFSFIIPCLCNVLSFLYAHIPYSFLSLCTYSIFRYQECPLIYYSSSTVRNAMGFATNLCSSMFFLEQSLQWWATTRKSPAITLGMTPELWYSLVMMGLQVFSSFCRSWTSTFSTVWFLSSQLMISLYLSRIFCFSSLLLLP